MTFNYIRQLLFTLLAFLLAFSAAAQQPKVTVSGRIKQVDTKQALPFVNVVLKSGLDSAFVTGTITSEDGSFSLDNIKPGNYLLEASFIGYKLKQQAIFIGSLSPYIDVADVFLTEDIAQLGEVEIVGTQEAVAEKMDKKTFTVEDNISQSGGSVLQTMQNLPGVTVQDGKVQLRGNDKVMVLIDGKQTALTGFGSQNALENIPASAIEKIEIINNPSSKFDANGNAGIINIIYKKDSKEGFNGKAGLTAGAGALWVKKENLPTIRPQYQTTPKVNPSLSLNYCKKRVNWFLQSDYNYTHTLNKNEFVERTYSDGTIINQQTKRNRNTSLATVKTGLDFAINDHNSLTISGFFSSEKILDNGDEPFFDATLTERLRLWQFLEDELKTTAMGMVNYQHKFKQAGHTLSAGLNYTFHRENEKYFFDNIYPTFTGYDSFKLLSDEHVADLNVDYVKPLKFGRFETGMKYRRRIIPTNMQFFPGLNSPLDTTAGGWATYKETIPALYGNYIIENQHIEAELGLRVEYVNLNYLVNPEHSTYSSNGYSYAQPFPNFRFAYKINENNKLSLFFNRRVDRPNEVDIRIFPKYDDAEIIKVGNPALRPQFTNSVELGYKSSWQKGYLFAAAYHKMATATITRISSTAPNSYLIYAVFQNAGKSTNSGVEMVFSQSFSKKFTLNFNATTYYNRIDSFTVKNLYPVPSTYSAPRQEIISGNAKLIGVFHFDNKLDAQISMVYLAPDIIPQGTIAARFACDLGVKRKIQKGKGEVFVNATDIFNTMQIKKHIVGNTFNYTSTDYYETQVVRIGYNYSF